MRRRRDCTANVPGHTQTGEKANAFIWRLVRRPYHTDTSLQRKIGSGCPQKSCQQILSVCQKMQWIHCLRFVKECTLSASYTTSVPVCLLSRRSLTMVKLLQRLWILCSSVRHTTSGVLRTKKTPSTTSLLLLTWRPCERVLKLFPPQPAIYSLLMLLMIPSTSAVWALVEKRVWLNWAIRATE